MPVISKKVLTQFLVTSLTLVVGFVVTKLGLNIGPLASGIISSAIATAAGAIAGYLVKESQKFLAVAIKK